MKTVDYLNLMNDELLWTDYRIAKELKTTKQTISNYRNKDQHFRDDIAILVAKKLNIDPLRVLADVHAQRAKDPAVKKVWQKLAASAAMLLLSTSFTMYSPDVSANASSGTILQVIDYAQLGCFLKD